LLYLRSIERDLTQMLGEVVEAVRHSPEPLVDSLQLRVDPIEPLADLDAQVSMASPLVMGWSLSSPVTQGS